VAETNEQAWHDAEQHLYYMMSAYDRRLKEAADLPWSQAVFSCPQVPPPGEMRKTHGLTFFQAPLVVGSPEDVAHELERYGNEGRVTHLVMWMQLPGMPAQKARRSMQLFANEVMPRFK
jgi:alkanesulfonate monooxygenase SsuD/methylene tetrahydromethanopterin reductase-like flavin-dependent oxidoreductase (luciferase family)